MPRGDPLWRAAVSSDATGTRTIHRIQTKLNQTECKRGTLSCAVLH